jgi:hypothetical protein
VAGSPVDRDRLAELPPPTAPPLHATPYAGRPAGLRPNPGARPPAVVWGCAITWVSTLIAGSVALLVLAQLLVTPDAVLEEFRRQNPELTLSDADLQSVILWGCVVILVWSVLAAGLAVLVWRRIPWAAVALGVSAALACLTVLPVVACIAVGILLLRPESRAWLRR